MLGSLVDIRKIHPDGPLGQLILFKDFYFLSFSLALDFLNHWVVPLNHHNLVGDLVELLHIFFP